MSETSQEARRALTEKRGKELDKWWAINYLRFMNCQDPISPTISDMPSEILVQVFEKLDSIEQLICRKVCRSLKPAVEKIEIHFDSISFEVFNENVTMKLDGLKILYNDVANGAFIVAYNNKEAMIKGENFLQLAFNDLGILLKRVRKFEFTIFRGAEHAIATSLLNVLKANQCVHVTKVEFSFLPLVDMCSILPYFDSEMLESIDLHCNDTNAHFEQLAQLEQWKNAKDFTIFSSMGDSIPIEHLLHFRSVDVDMEKLSLQKVIEIRDKLLIRSTFEECFLWLESSNLIEIARVFQPHYSGSEAFEIEYLSNSDKFKISCGKSDIWQKWWLNIERSDIILNLSSSLPRLDLSFEYSRFAFPIDFFFSIVFCLYFFYYYFLPVVHIIFTTKNRNKLN